MIPDIIHFVWIGEDLPDFAKVCISRFKELNPHYQIRIHSDKFVHPRYRDVYGKLKDVCSKSDLIRLSVLEEHGGWYFDTDFLPLRSIDDIKLSYEIPGGFFLTRQTDKNRTKSIANGIIGCSKDSAVWPMLTKECEFAANRKLERTTFGPILVTKLANKLPELITVGKQDDFYPYPFSRRRKAREKLQELVRSAGYSPVELPPSAFCIHLWAGGRSGISVPPQLRLKGSKTAVVIANNRGEGKDYCHCVNSADLVLRMNRCIGFGDEQKRMGFRTDILGIISSGAGGRQFTRPKSYMRPGGRVRGQISEVWYSRPMDWVEGRRKEIGKAIADAQQFDDVKIVYPSNELWKSLEEKLRAIQPNYIVPSTGMVMIEMLLNDNRFKEYKIHLLGFTHKGWKSHPFEAEKALIQQYIEIGRLQRVEDTELESQSFAIGSQREL